jgi:hypothetical protein
MHAEDIKSGFGCQGDFIAADRQPTNKAKGTFHLF